MAVLPAAKTELNLQKNGFLLLFYFLSFHFSAYFWGEQENDKTKLWLTGPNVLIWFLLIFLHPEFITEWRAQCPVTLLCIYFPLIQFEGSCAEQGKTPPLCREHRLLSFPAPASVGTFSVTSLLWKHYPLFVTHLDFTQSRAADPPAPACFATRGCDSLSMEDVLFPRYCGDEKLGALLLCCRLINTKLSEKRPRTAKDTYLQLNRMPLKEKKTY